MPRRPTARAVPPRRALVIFFSPPLAEWLDAFRRAHDPVTSAAIAPHVTVVHDLDAETERRIDAAAAAAQPFRIRLGRAVRLDGGLKGCAIRVDDADGGLARLSIALGLKPSSLPHVTLLNPRTVRDEAHSDTSWRALRELALDDVVSVNALTLVEERGDQWHELQRFVLGS